MYIYIYIGWNSSAVHDWSWQQTQRNSLLHCGSGSVQGGGMLKKTFPLSCCHQQP